MRSLAVFLASVYIVAPASATTLIGNNPNVNGGGLNMSPPGVWVKIGGGQSASLENNRGGSDGGDWLVGGDSGCCNPCSASYNNYYAQAFAPPSGPGLYDVRLSGWLKAFASWYGYDQNFNFVQEAHLELYIDGALVADLNVNNNDNDGSPDRDIWRYRCFNRQIQINTSIEVRLHSIKAPGNYTPPEKPCGGTPVSAVYYQSRYDDIRLDVDLAPTPPAGVLIGSFPDVKDGGLYAAPAGSAWTKVGSGPNARIENDHNLCPDPDDGGDWAVGGANGSGSSPAYNNYYSQTFPAASLPNGAGDYDVVLTGYVKAWASWWSGENYGFVQEAHIELLIDGATVADLSASNLVPSERNNWLFKKYCAQHEVNSSIEVRLHSVKDYGNGGLGAIYFDSRYDDIQLEVSPAGEGCADPSAITNVTPGQYILPPAPGLESIVIAGTNLANVTGVYLSGPAVIPGNVTAQSAGQITAEFDLSTAPFGSYDMVVRRDCPCLDVTEVGAVEIACVSPETTVTGILPRSVAGDGNRGMAGTFSHTIQLTGTNLASITGVKLRKTRNNESTAEIPGSGLTMVGDNLRVTFNLFFAEAGWWDLVVTHPCDLVNSNDLVEAFLVYVPELTNGSFEEGYRPDLYVNSVCENPAQYGNRYKAKHWDLGPTTTAASHNRDGNVWPPQCEGGRVKNGTGDHYNGLSVNTTVTDTVSFFQTIAAPNIDGSNTTTAPFSIRGEFAIMGGSTANPVLAKIRLLDGTPTDFMQEFSTEIPSEFEASWEGALVADADYNAVVPGGVTYGSNPPTLTILFEFTTSGQGVNGLYGFWMDNVRAGKFVPPDCAAIPLVFDIDEDGDVDQKDFAAFQRCLGVTPIPEECRCINRDSTGASDSVIDAADFAIFLNCAQGPAVPANPACDDPAP